MSDLVILLARGRGADVLLPLFGFVIGSFVLGLPYWAVYFKHLRCPRCGSEMVERVATRGRNRGGGFLGCVLFPACKGTRSSPHPLGVIVTGVACGCLMILGYGFLTEEWHWRGWQSGLTLVALWLASVWLLDRYSAPPQAKSATKIPYVLKSCFPVKWVIILWRTFKRVKSATKIPDAGVKDVWTDTNEPASLESENTTPPTGLTCLLYLIFIIGVCLAIAFLNR